MDFCKSFAESGKWSDVNEEEQNGYQLDGWIALGGGKGVPFFKIP